MYVTLGFVKNLNANVDFFKDMIRVEVNTTTMIVDVGAQSAGSFIIPIINASKKRGGNFSSIFLNDSLFFIASNIKQPDDISQNLEGIRKYAAGWLIG